MIDLRTISIGKVGMEPRGVLRALLFGTLSASGSVQLGHDFWADRNCTEHTTEEADIVATHDAPHTPMSEGVCVEDTRISFGPFAYVTGVDGQVGYQQSNWFECVACDRIRLHWSLASPSCSSSAPQTNTIDIQLSSVGDGRVCLDDNYEEDGDACLPRRVGCNETEEAGLCFPGFDPVICGRSFHYLTSERCGPCDCQSDEDCQDGQLCDCTPEEHVHGVQPGEHHVHQEPPSRSMLFTAVPPIGSSTTTCKCRQPHA
mmetsp:Transcript_21283/g.45654  ORF Transcript_21283/g.45654 Transcript_21283/m.45654 type:complete len:259 (+) Transcript_21283:50-826(+)